MAYLSQSTLSAALGSALTLRLLDDDNDGTADTAAVAQVVDDVTALLNGYIGRVYTVATVAANPPATVTMIARMAGKHFAYLRRPEFKNERGETPCEGEFKEALRMLREIGERKFRLDIDESPQVPANVKSSVRTGTYDNDDVTYGFVKDGTGSGGF